MLDGVIVQIRRGAGEGGERGLAIASARAKANGAIGGDDGG